MPCTLTNTNYTRKVYLLKSRTIKKGSQMITLFCLFNLDSSIKLQLNPD